MGALFMNSWFTQDTFGLFIHWGPRLHLADLVSDVKNATLITTKNTSV